MQFVFSIYYKKLFAAIAILVTFTACSVTYSFKDTVIDYNKLKTIKINFIENKARYVNPQLSVKLTDKIQQKIASQTKLIRTNNDNPNLEVSGYISNYDPSLTVGIANQQTATNRLTVTVHLVYKNNVSNTTQEFDISKNFDFNANQSLQDMEAARLDIEIIPAISDEIFNKLFSNW